MIYEKYGLRITEQQKDFFASQRFYQAKCIIEPKGAHQFQAFERFLPMVCQWLLLSLDNNKA